MVSLCSIANVCCALAGCICMQGAFIHLSQYQYLYVLGCRHNVETPGTCPRHACFTLLDWHFS